VLGAFSPKYVHTCPFRNSGWLPGHTGHVFVPRQGDCRSSVWSCSLRELANVQSRLLSRPPPDDGSHAGSGCGPFGSMPLRICNASVCAYATLDPPADQEAASAARRSPELPQVSRATVRARADDGASWFALRSTASGLTGHGTRLFLGTQTTLQLTPV
jgi:hypothetical protein